MISNKKTIIFVIILVIIVLLAGASFYFFYLKKENQAQPAPSITEQEKVQILDKLGQKADTSSAGVKKQEDILKKLNGGKAESKPLTTEEKQKIMNSFNNL